MKRTLGLVFSLALVGCGVDQPNTLLSGGTTSTGTGQGTTHAATTGASTTSSSGSSMSSGTGGTGGMPMKAAFEVTVDKPDASIALAAELVLNVTIDPKGYSGNVLLGSSAVDGAGLTADFAMSSLTLDGSSKAKTTLTFKSKSSTPPNTVGYTLTAASPDGSATVTGAVTVISDITIVIPKNVAGLPGNAAMPYKDAFGPYPTMIVAPAGISAQNPVIVRFYNDDDVPHEIHAGQGNEGFPHDQMEIPANSMDPMVRLVTAADTYDYYLHDQGAAQTVGRIVIQ